ncbi:MBL fold metallo-hydrolase [Albibacterium bauzanense]|uniref:Glyoxylase-like metal-dependent hydrolase (Beta-lactamase superfamily II) n=1 Tax=Albibacterium bauzanense TaxID=653929 RepID=A0A4R1M1Y8_9SPHI|nr:MBL fold metallo-hydrolase [Albibacterium bauzanense]TCK83629.1 glyoxylase-like metal-dependent hydrolase (beta-lactamase superfamily II) [Albibacterium bauzanense]
MKIKQFEDKFLSHYSYAILSECESKMILIDPARDPKPYYDYAIENNAEIIGIIETHPHADFVSSHLEIHKQASSPIYASKLTRPDYPFLSFDEGDVLEIGKIRLRALNTPGHSPDSICIVLEHEGIDKALFSGDTLFIGDCGRPDLRESGGDVNAERMHLASQMYHSLRDQLMKLSDDVVLYPAHGAGTLCGKALSEANSSTMGEEKKTNWSLKEMTEQEFVKELTSNQPFIPAYFPYDVALNKKGAADFQPSVAQVAISEGNPEEQENIWIIDSRKDTEFKAAHQQHSVNIMEGTKFETWLGSIISPEEPFYLKAKDEATLKALIARTASIGYEGQIKGAYFAGGGELKMEALDLQDFRNDTGKYTIVDVRNESEVKEHKIFKDSIPIPLGELRDRIDEIPNGKPIAVHCAGGYRSAAASSMIEAEKKGKVPVFDIGEAIKQFS